MKHLLIPLLLLGLVFSAYSQEKPRHPASITQAEDGTIYVNKKLGIYIFIGSGPEPSDSLVRLKSEKEDAQYTNPFYFDTEGINTIRSPWLIDPESKEYVRPRRDVRFNVYTDSKAPVSGAYVGDSLLEHGQEQTIRPGDEVVLKAEDAISGVQAIYFSVQGEPYEQYKRSLPFSREGTFTLKYYAVDLVGNDEEVDTLKIKVDRKAPKSSLLKEGPHHESIFSREGSFRIKATDERSGVAAVYYQIDSGNRKTYTRPLLTKTLTEGAHTLTYFAVDSAGNKENRQTFTFYMDDTPPRIAQQIEGDRYYANGVAYSSGRSKLKITAVDNKAGVEAIYYRINQGKRKRYEDPFLLPASQGDMQITAYAVDRVENSSKGDVQEQSQFTATYRDLTGPELTWNYRGPKMQQRDSLFIQPETSISLAISDKEAGARKITYALDGSEPRDYTEPFHITSAGFHTLKVTGYDHVNNTTVKTLQFVVDNQGPRIYTHFSIVPLHREETETDTLSYPLYTQLYLSATDRSSGVKDLFYRINGSRKKPYMAPIDAFFRKGLYELEIITSDYLGNQHTETLPVRIIP